MLLGSFLSLFMVPAAYRVLASKLAPEPASTEDQPGGAADGALPGPARQMAD